MVFLLMARETDKVVKYSLLGSRAVSSFNEGSKDLPVLSSEKLERKKTDCLVSPGAPVSIIWCDAVATLHGIQHGLPYPPEPVELPIL